MAQHRYGRYDMDVMLDTKCRRGASRDASRAQTRRSVIVRRAWACTGGKRSEVAKSADTGLEEDWRGLPPESTNWCSHRKSGVRHRATQDGLYEGSSAYDLSLRGMRSAAVKAIEAAARTRSRRY